MEINRFITHELADYQVMVEFTDDEEAIQFNEWLQDYGFAIFRSWKKQV